VQDIRPRLHWCPTGVFSHLPLHAAGIHDGGRRVCCADFVVSSYTPTVTALLRAQRKTAPLSRASLSLALVAEKQAQDPGLQVIAGVDEEAELVAAVATSSKINVILQQVGETTILGTSDMLQTANVVHLACHGVQDSTDATQSGFCLGDGRLTISMLMELKLDRAFLAFLSACETAKGDKEQPDQVMHLAAAMLFCGFKSVVATMWCVGDTAMSECVLITSRAISDADGPKVAQWFYEELLSKEEIDLDRVAFALDAAVIKLRDSGVPPDRWVPFIHMGA
jgi:CHAT domain-containing protein